MEKWDLFDKDRRPLHKIHARGNDMVLGEYHIVVDVWTVNSKDEILVTLRHPKKEIYPNFWENTSGSALAGETSKQAAIRELFEETGIFALEDELVYLGTLQEKTAFVDTYALRKDIQVHELTMQDGETTDAKWVTWEQLTEMIDSGTIAQPVVCRLDNLRKGFLKFLNRR